MITSLRILLKVRNVSDKSCRENQNTRFMSNNFIFFEKRAVYEIMWKKYYRVGRATWQYNVAPALCMLDSLQTLRLYNTYSFLTTTMATRTPLIVTWYVHCLSCLNGVNLKLIRVPCCKAGHYILVYSNSCTIIRYNSVQTCDSPPTCFGLFRQFSRRHSKIQSLYFYMSSASLRIAEKGRNM